MWRRQQRCLSTNGRGNADAKEAGGWSVACGESGCSGGGAVSVRALLLVDGYNVLFARGGVTAGGAGAQEARRTDDAEAIDPYETARNGLVSRLAAAYKASYELVVVFDSGRNIGVLDAESCVAGVRVVFSRHGESADAVIERLCSEALHKGRDVVVATNDAAVRATCAGAGAEIFSATKVLEDAGEAAELAAEFMEEETVQKMTLGDRLDPSVYAKLRAFVEGKSEL